MNQNSQILILGYSQTKQIISLFPIVFTFCNPSLLVSLEQLTNFNMSVGSVVKDSFANDVYNQKL